jgi:hypothetical protein
MADPAVSVAAILIDPSLDWKLKVPPVQPVFPVPGQTTFTVPAGLVVGELTEAPDPPEPEPPELLRLPWSA